jgi:hypothetical protein
MSAFIVDPRLIDYLVSWTQRHSDNGSMRTGRIERDPASLPEALRFLAHTWGTGFYLDLSQIPPNVLGQILFDECVRSVAYCYSDTKPEDLPGPTTDHPDYNRIRHYVHKPIRTMLRPAWVVKCCDCYRYQSCETDDWKTTVAYAVNDAIRESAIHVLTKDAPWDLSDDDLVEHGPERRAGMGGRS